MSGDQISGVQADGLAVAPRYNANGKFQAKLPGNRLGFGAEPVLVRIVSSPKSELNKLVASRDRRQISQAGKDELRPAAVARERMGKNAPDNQLEITLQEAWIDLQLRIAVLNSGAGDPFAAIVRLDATRFERFVSDLAGEFGIGEPAVRSGGDEDRDGVP